MERFYGMINLKCEAILCRRLATPSNHGACAHLGLPLPHERLQSLLQLLLWWHDGCVMLSQFQAGQFSALASRLRLMGAA